MIRVNPYAETYFPIENWRNANSEAWDFARWINGMQASRDGVIEKNKTIVCGHWHCSYGHRFLKVKVLNLIKMQILHLTTQKEL